MSAINYRDVLSGQGSQYNTFPLSSSQERLWLLYQLYPSNPAYHMCGGVRIQGPLDLDRLAGAICTLCERHEALRTVFRELGDDTVQVVLKEPPAALEVHSFEAGDLSAMVATEARRPFDLHVAPIRFTCLQVGVDDHVLIFTVHHLVCDGVSVGILVRELSMLYGGASALDPLPIQFADFALWERHQIAEGRFEAELGWWREALTGIPTLLDLPADDGQGSHRFTIPDQIADNVHRLAATERTTPFVVVLAAFALALGAQAGRTNFVIGTPVSGRPFPETEKVVGLFVNTLPLPIRLASRGSLRDAVRGLRGMVTQALSHAAVPFDRIVEAVGASRLDGQTPLVQALLAWQSWPGLGALNLVGTEVTEVPVEVSAPKFDVSLDVSQSPEGWMARLEYKRMAVETVAKLTQRLMSVVASDPDRVFTINVIERSCPGDPIQIPAGGREPIDWVEATVAEVWQEVLGVSSVGRTDDFFELGGHSLLGARLLTRIRSRTGADLPLRVLFEAPTVAALAGRVRTAHLTISEPIPLAPPGPSKLSSYQQSLWFVNRLDPTSVTYNLTCALRIEGPIDAEALFATLGEVVARQPTLRTTFHLIDGEPVQVVSDAATFDLDLCRLGNVSTDALDAALCSAADRLAALPFDLGRDAPLRGVWVDGGKGGTGLVLGTTTAAMDGSYTVFRTELEQTYAAQVGLGTAGPAPRINYADYAAWQRSRLPDIIRTHLPYWKEQMASIVESLQLPTDRPRPALRKGKGAVRAFGIDPALARQVRAIARAEGVTVHMVLLAAWTVLLHRMSGQEHFVVGSPVQVRPDDVENVIGCFVNPVVLRADLSGKPTVREVIARTRATVLDAYEHAELPFDVVVEALGGPRDLSRTPLFQVMFVFGEAPTPPRFGSATTTFVEWSPSVSRYDMLWAMHDLPNGALGGVVEYDTDLFDASTIDRMAHLFEFILAAAMDAPQTHIDQLPLLGPADRHQILVEWNQTEHEVEGKLTLHERFEQAADRFPNAPAVLFQDRVMTYSELEERANRWAHLLVSKGISRGDRVGFWVDRCGESVEILLAILKVGAAYVPMDTRWPTARVGWVARELGLPMILTQEHFAAELAVIDLPRLRHRIAIEHVETARQLEAVSSTRLLTTSGPDDNAYVIFTSGSTGSPKGVVVRHRPIVNVIDWVNRTFSVNTTDRLLFVTAYGFDLSVYDIFGILAAGGSIRVVETDYLYDPARLWSLLRSDGITFWDSAPAALVQLVPLLQSHPPDPASALRLVFLSGDWIPLSLPDEVRRVFPGAEVVSLGGATEAVIWSNFHRIGEIAPHWRSIPYGRPIQNAAYYVLDAQLEPCPIGIAGDLYIGGPVLADGYTDPALTVERFVPDPHARRAGAVMYRTGDRARFWPDGTIEFLGRADQQLKVRGYRIERGEIEVVLGAHPGVATCVVLPRPDRHGDHRLIAWYVPRDDRSLTTTDLRAHVAAKVPDYMVPSAFVEIDSIPFTSNGKVDVNRLPDPPATRPMLEAAFVAPRSDLEQIVARVWCRVLEVERVGAGDNFFDLGGHSAAMIRAQADLEQALGRSVPIIELFHYPTVELLARYLAEGTAALHQGEDQKLESRRLLAQRNRQQRNRLQGK